MTSTPAPRFDAKRELSCYRARAGRIDLVEVPPMRFLMIDGAGDPNTSPAYEAALGDRLKALSRKELGRDYVVPPLEGLWWAEDMEAFTARRDKDRWQWRMMLMTPPFIEAEHLAAAGLAEGGPVRWEAFDEGRCLQTLHIGPYDAEGPVLERLHHEEVPARGLALRGLHHEIYLGDPRRAAPERLRTILRQPVRDAR
jgi:hypothetical protein